jgi:hypothetical protein
LLTTSSPVFDVHNSKERFRSIKPAEILTSTSSSFEYCGALNF